jgi:hypothetical protein
MTTTLPIRQSSDSRVIRPAQVGFPLPAQMARRSRLPRRRGLAYPNPAGPAILPRLALPGRPARSSGNYGGSRPVLWLRPKAGLGAFLVILAPPKIWKGQLSCHGGWPARQDHG